MARSRLPAPAYVEGAYPLNTQIRNNESTESEELTSNGLIAWVSGGLLLTISEQFNAGLDGRHSYIPMQLGGDSLEAGGSTTILSLGCRFQM